MRAAVLWGLWIGLSGCSEGLATISVDVEDSTVVEGGGLLSELIGSLGFEGFTDMNVVAAQELQNQGVEPGDIVEVRLTRVELSAAQPEGADLSFLSTMDISVTAPDLAEASVAAQDTFPEGQATVALDLVDVDLTDYVVSESMTLTMDVDGMLPEEDTEVHALISMDIRVTAQGLVNQASAQ